MGSGDQAMNVCVLGLWHLGCVTAAGLATVGHRVTGLDFDAAAVENLRLGAAPLFEPGLNKLIKDGLGAGTLQFCSEPGPWIEQSEVLIVAYDTPVNADDVADVDFVIGQIERTLPFLGRGTTVLVSSQLPVGSVQRLERIAALTYPTLDLDFACSPENLRLGRALEVFQTPDRIVAGARSPRGQERLERLFAPITDRIEWMSVESAEMTKHAINAFLATSVTFANELAVICEAMGADPRDVARGLKSDIRIGPKAYLAPGAAFAGGTLARDIEFLERIAQEQQLQTPLVAAVRPSNDAHKQWPARKIEALFDDLQNLSVAVWGLTYKAGTDTLRRSLAVDFCDWLIGRGARIRCHDPVVKELPQRWAGKVGWFDSPLAAGESAQVLVIFTEWPLYREIEADHLIAHRNPLIILDPSGFATQFAGSANLRYFSVGSPSVKGMK